jgi:hypothetical protein
MYGHGSYKTLFKLPAITKELISVGPQEPLLPLLPRVRGSSLNPHAVNWMGRELNFFDTAALVEMVKKGVNFETEGLIPGSVGIRGNSGCKEGFHYIRPKMLELHDLNRVIIPNKKQKAKIIKDFQRSSFPVVRI